MPKLFTNSHVGRFRSNTQLCRSNSKLAAVRMRAPFHKVIRQTKYQRPANHCLSMRVLLMYSDLVMSKTTELENTGWRVEKLTNSQFMGPRTQPEIDVGLLFSTRAKFEMMMRYGTIGALVRLIGHKGTAEGEANGGSPVSR